jgi:hypothetical protein
MSLAELQTAVASLSLVELADFRAWFLRCDAAVWDSQFEEDVTAGRLDSLANEALQDLHQGAVTEIQPFRVRT